MMDIVGCPKCKRWFRDDQAMQCAGCGHDYCVNDFADHPCWGENLQKRKEKE